MSIEDLLDENACGCCEVPVPPTPKVVRNRPGLTAIRYRVGTFSSFRQVMIEAIAKAELDGSKSRSLEAWTARTQDDYGIAVLEMWAYLADILTFYQERIANEAFLRTALLRESVLRLAALLDYEPAPGVAATAHLTFTLEEDKQVMIPIGLRVQSVPGQDEEPQKFETEESFTADAQLNQVRIFPKPESGKPFDAESTEGFLEPESASSVVEELSPGDQFVVFFRGRDGTTEEKEVTALQAQQALTKLTWEPEIQSDARNTDNSQAFKFIRKFRLFGFNAPTEYLHSSPDEAGGFKFSKITEGDFIIGNNGIEVDYTFDLPPIDSPGNKLYLDSVYDDLKKGTQVLIPVRGQSLGTAPITSTRSIPLYRLYHPSVQDHFYTANPAERAQAISSGGYQDEGIVGYIFPTHESETTPFYRLFNPSTGDHFYTTSAAEKNQFISSRGYRDDGIAGYVFPSQKPGRTPLYRLFHSAAGDHFYTTKAVERDRAYSVLGYSFPDPPGGNGIACYIYVYMSNTVWTTVTDTRQVARQKGLLNATVTEITVKDPIPPIENLREIEVYELAGPEIRFRNRHYHYPLGGISGGTAYVPLSQLESLETNRTLMLDDQKAEPQLVMVTGAVAEDGHLAISFTPQLRRPLDTKTAMLYGNVAKATHGETVAGEVLGNGDASAGFQSFQIRKSPVTFVPEPGESHGAANTLQVRVDGALWHEVDTLFGRQKDERVYTTSVDDEKTMTLRFGNGINGARLPSGRNNMVATYRQGLGQDGNVRANALATLLDRPVGLKSVTNLVEARGGADPESRDETRINAPNTVRTFGRIVSLRDFEDAAREFAGVAKAHATSEWDGSEQMVRLIVAGDEGRDVTEETKKNLVKDLNARRDPNRKMTVETYQKVFIQVEAVIHVDPDFVDEEVRAAAHAALLGYFTFDNLELGQPIHLSSVYQALQEVRGVVAVNIERLRFKGSSVSFQDTAADPASVTQLRLDSAAVRQAQGVMSGDLSSFPILTSARPEVGVTIGKEGPRTAALGAVPTNLARARSLLEAAIRSAYTSSAFAAARVDVVGSRLLVLPGTTDEAVQEHLRILPEGLARIERPADDAIVRVGTRRT